MGKIGAVVGEEGYFVDPVGSSDTLQERIGRGCNTFRVDPLLCNLVEIATRALDGSPARFPASQVEAVLPCADDVVEVLENKQQLRQFIESLKVISQRRAMTMLRKNVVA